MLGKRRRYAPYNNSYKKSRIPRPIYMARTRSSASNIPVPSGISPSSGLTRIKYSFNATLSSTTNVGYEVVRANGLFDPEVTVGGHQPLGFDQWMSFYTYFCVVGAKCTVTAVPGAGATEPMVFGVYPTSNTSPPSKWYTAVEQPGSRYSILGTSTAISARSVTAYFSAKRMFGVKNVLDEADLRGTASADPTKGAYFMVFGQGQDGATSTTIDVVVTIEYMVKFLQRGRLLSS